MLMGNGRVAKGVNMKIGDLVKFVTKDTQGMMPSSTVGVVLPPTEGMSRHWTRTTDDEMVNVFWTHVGIMPYAKRYIEVVK
jgi:hypothetical protein